MKDRLLGGLNTLLMFNLFFVLFCFAWFAIALIGRAADVNLGFDLWYSLWDPVIMPSIGILMAGALISGLSSWVNQKFLQRSQKL
ncbi:MAG: hypothetical protein ACFB16_07900 [Phormidesmis sp.]